MQKYGTENNLFSKEETEAIERILEGIALRAGTHALQYLASQYFVPESFIDYALRMEESAWRTMLTPLQFSVLRKKGTENAFSGLLYGEKRRGSYCCVATQEPLFSSENKFDSGSGWPSFTNPIDACAVRYVIDTRHGITRIEVLDSLSGCHMGHVFADGPADTGLRYCINSTALSFVSEE